MTPVTVTAARRRRRDVPAEHQGDAVSTSFGASPSSLRLTRLLAREIAARWSSRGTHRRLSACLSAADGTKVGPEMGRNRDFLSAPLPPLAARVLCIAVRSPRLELFI